VGSDLDQSAEAGRPIVELAGVDVAFRLLADAMSGLSEGDARGATLLPGWTRGHLLTHLARNADSQRGMVDGALRHEIAEQYPGGDEQRSSDIEVGAGRPIDALRADVHATQQALVSAWARIPDDAWERLTGARAGVRPVRSGVLSRWREISVHLVDLDVGVGPDQLAADYRERDAEWLAEHRAGTWSHRS
jgi:maleylpyruvate isomerase